jgi:hypothetical protein
VVAGGIFPKDEVEQQQQLMYFKNKVFTITATGRISQTLLKCTDLLTP